MSFFKHNRSGSYNQTCIILKYTRWLLHTQLKALVWLYSPMVQWCHSLKNTIKLLARIPVCFPEVAGNLDFSAYKTWRIKAEKPQSCSTVAEASRNCWYTPLNIRYQQHNRKAFLSLAAFLNWEMKYPFIYQPQIRINFNTLLLKMPI